MLKIVSRWMNCISNYLLAVIIFILSIIIFHGETICSLDVHSFEYYRLLLEINQRYEP